MKNAIRLLSSFLLVFAFAISPAFAAFNKDLSLGSGDIRGPSSMLLNGIARIYATVHNNSSSDLSGVVKFYDESVQRFIGTDQPVSIVAGKTDDVFIDWSGDTLGVHIIAVRVVPWFTEEDDPANNKGSVTIYVDRDSDGDGVVDREDVDDDNDAVPDRADAFPLNSEESVDTDGDRVGNNADLDDDGDGIFDVEDAFPLDANESKDGDQDGAGDNSDLFPADPKEQRDSDGDGLGDNADPNDQNKGPIPELVAEKTEAKAKDVITFNALKSRDPDGDIVSYEWDFGDGQKATGVVVDHAFKDPGYYKVTLKLLDNSNEPRETSVTIHITYKWQLMALIGATALLILLLLGGALLKVKRKKAVKTAPVAKKTVRSAKKNKKNLPKRKK